MPWALGSVRALFWPVRASLAYDGSTEQASPSAVRTAVVARGSAARGSARCGRDHLVPEGDVWCWGRRVTPERGSEGRGRSGEESSPRPQREARDCPRWGGGGWGGHTAPLGRAVRTSLCIRRVSSSRRGQDWTPNGQRGEKGPVLRKVWKQSQQERKPKFNP